MNDARNHKPLKRFDCRSCGSTGLKPGVNESAARKPLQLLMILLALSFVSAVFAAPQDAEYEGVAEEYVKTYLAAHPLQGTAKLAITAASRSKLNSTGFGDSMIGWPSLIQRN
jgi:hypothetical protein